jgi:hypothetical protein
MTIFQTSTICCLNYNNCRTKIVRRTNSIEFTLQDNKDVVTQTLLKRLEMQAFVVISRSYTVLTRCQQEDVAGRDKCNWLSYIDSKFAQAMPDISDLHVVTNKS